MAGGLLRWKDHAPDEDNLQQRLYVNFGRSAASNFARISISRAEMLSNAINEIAQPENSSAQRGAAGSLWARRNGRLSPQYFFIRSGSAAGAYRMIRRPSSD